MNLEFEAEESEGLSRYVSIIDSIKKVAIKTYKTNLRTFYHPTKLMNSIS